MIKVVSGSVLSQFAGLQLLSTCDCSFNFLNVGFFLSKLLQNGFMIKVVDIFNMIVGFVCLSELFGWISGVNSLEDT